MRRLVTFFRTAVGGEIFKGEFAEIVRMDDRIRVKVRDDDIFVIDPLIVEVLFQLFSP